MLIIPYKILILSGLLKLLLSSSISNTKKQKDFLPNKLYNFKEKQNNIYSSQPNNIFSNSYKLSLSYTDYEYCKRSPLYVIYEENELSCDYKDYPSSSSSLSVSYNESDNSSCDKNLYLCNDNSEYSSKNKDLESSDERLYHYKNYYLSNKNKKPVNFDKNLELSNENFYHFENYNLPNKNNKVSNYENKLKSHNNTKNKKSNNKNNYLYNYNWNILSNNENKKCCEIKKDISIFFDKESKLPYTKKNNMYYNYNKEKKENCDSSSDEFGSCCDFKYLLHSNSSELLSDSKESNFDVDSINYSNSEERFLSVDDYLNDSGLKNNNFKPNNNMYQNIENNVKFNTL